MAKLIIVGDPHVKNKNLELSNQLLTFVEGQATAANADAIVLMGDLFDTKEVIRGKSLNAVFNFVQTSKHRWIMLVGNHDYFNLECEEHSLEVFKKLDNVKVVDHWYGDYGCEFIPYYHDMDKLRDTLSQMNPGKVLFGHLDVVAFDYGNGYMSESGLDLKDLAPFKKVISGHYHKYQEKGNLTYIGTPFSHSFGESNQDKYIGVFDTETCNMDLIETPFPRHVTIEVDCDTRQPSTYSGGTDYIRLILNGKAENILTWRTRSTFGDSIKIIERPSDEFMNNVSIDETADNLVKFKEWADEIRGLDPETTQLGLEILEAVK